MSNDIEKPEEMDKAELVYVMTLMLNCLDFKDQLNKLSKPCLFRLYDDMQARGNAFANLEDDKRKLEAELTEARGQVRALEVRNAILDKKMKNDYHKGNQCHKNKR